MFASVRIATLTAIVSAAFIFLPNQQAQAGPFLNWLFGRPVLVYPSPYVAGYPSAPVAAVPAAQTAYYAPYAVAAAPQVTMAAQPVMAPAPVAVQPVMSGYATYRTTWNRIPVTYYRPMTTYTAGYPVTTAQPCNAYTWQAQRVPTHSFRPWIPFAAAPVTYGYAPQPSPVMYAPQPATNYAPVAPNCGACPTTGAVAPGTVAPETTTPFYSPLDSGSVVPSVGTGAETADPATGFSNDPANQAPTLSPGSYSTEPAINPPALQSIPEYSPAIPAGSASAPRSANSPYRVTPIPAPDVRTFGSQKKSPQAPPLLNSRERTVSNAAGQPVSVERASWVTSKPVTTQPAARQVTPTTPAPKKQLWDDSGWRSSSR
jgi:hypothetical protein